MTQVIKLSDNAAIRIKEIMSSADNLPLVLEWVFKPADAQACLILWNTPKI